MLKYSNFVGKPRTWQHYKEVTLRNTRVYVSFSVLIFTGAVADECVVNIKETLIRE